MKTRLAVAGLLIGIMFFAAVGSAQAVERNFPAGSLVIPMDKFYQPEADNGILEAYGLVYYLLAHKDANGEHDITVYWIVNDQKTAINALDFVIEDLTLPAGQAVARKYDHKGGSAPLTFKSGDTFQRVSYLGAPWIIDAQDAAKAKAIIDLSGWAAVDVHVAQVPFKAPVHRELRGTPPIIALMNSNESLTGGNAAILESYLRMAGICTDVYEVVTPNQIRDGILSQQNYDFLWAPHWDGNTRDGNKNGLPDEQDITNQIGEFLKQGKGLLGECACIMIFEKYGRFLSTLDISYNGGTMNPADIIYNDKASVFPQIGDYGFVPVSGKLKNWKAKTTPANYNATVTRFTIDKTGWDYYVGGYAFGDRSNGYVVYLGGHSYGSCSSGRGVKIDPNVNRQRLSFLFEKSVSTEVFTLRVKYDGGQTSEISFKKADLGTVKTGGTGSLRFDLNTADVYYNVLEDITLENTGTAPLTVESVTLLWTGGDSKQKLKKIIDAKTDDELFSGPSVVSGVELAITNLIIPSIDPNSGLGGCAQNDDCRPKNIAAVRYILNTLFDIKYHISNREYARAAAIVIHPFLYQGTFDFPAWRGHFRRYVVTSAASTAAWDTAAG